MSRRYQRRDSSLKMRTFLKQFSDMAITELAKEKFEYYLKASGKGNGHQIIARPVIKPSPKSCLAPTRVSGDSPLCIVYIIPQHSTLIVYSNLNGSPLVPSFGDLYYLYRTEGP